MTKRKCLYPKCITILRSSNRGRICDAHYSTFRDWFEGQKSEIHEARKKIYVTPAKDRTPAQRRKQKQLKIRSKRLNMKYQIGYGSNYMGYGK